MTAEHLKLLDELDIGDMVVVSTKDTTAVYQVCDFVLLTKVLKKRGPTQAAVFLSEKDVFDSRPLTYLPNRAYVMLRQIGSATTVEEAKELAAKRLSGTIGNKTHILTKERVSVLLKYSLVSLWE